MISWPLFPCLLLCRLTLKARNWYFLSVSHSKPKPLTLSAGDLHVMVNGEVKLNADLAYPQACHDKHSIVKVMVFLET